MDNLIACWVFNVELFSQSFGEYLEAKSRSPWVLGNWPVLTERNGHLSRFCDMASDHNVNCSNQKER